MKIINPFLIYLIMLLLLYQVYIGRRQITENESNEVIIDNYDGSYSGDVPKQTVYDDIGEARVLHVPDFTGDDIVDLYDFNMLATGWLSFGNINDDVTGDGCVDNDDLDFLLEY